MSIQGKINGRKQIEALVGDVRIPLAPLDSRHIDIVLKCLFRAFRNAKDHAAEIIKSGSEVEITALVISFMNREIDKNPIFKDIISNVSRGVESISHDGTKLEKRPDISICLMDRPPQFPLIIEAKIIDRHTRKTVSLYCEQGIRRFLDGDYGWACREAMMLAYVRDGSRIMTEIDPYMNRMNASGVTDHETIAIEDSERALSRHDRQFFYPFQQLSEQKPGHISIWHIWIQC